MYEIITTAPEPPRPKLRDQRPLLKQIAITIALVMVVALLLDGPFMWMLVAVGVGFVAFRGYQLNQALQPPVMGVETYQSAARPAKVETVVLDGSAEGDALPDQEVAEIVAEAVEGEHVLYSERAHALLLIEALLRVAPSLLVLWGFAVLQPILASVSDRAFTQVVLAGVATGSFLMLGASKSQKFKWASSPRLAKVALVVSLASLASLAWTEALVLITLGLVLAGGYVTLRSWAKWYYTRYVVTESRITIERKIPWFYFMEDSKPFVPTKKLSSVTAKQSTFEKFLATWISVDCGSFDADTPGQRDEVFHDMRRIRDHSKLNEILDAMILG